MQGIIASCLRTRTLVAALAVIAFGFSINEIRRARLDAVPEFSPLTLVVKSEALGLSAAEVEALITVPQEADLLAGVPWLRRIESESMAGTSTIELTFEPGTELMRARQMVQERLTQAHALPQVSTPPVLLNPVSSASRIMNIGLSSDTVSLIDMTVQAHWSIVPRLNAVPGVANVSIWGRRQRQMQVHVDPSRLYERGVSLDHVIKTAGEAVFASPLTYLSSSTPGTGGFIDTPNQRLNIRHVSPIVSPEQFARLPVNESRLMLGQVADVVEGHQPLIGDAVVNGGPGLMLVVEKFPGYNTQDVTRGIEAAMAELRPGMGGIRVDTAIYRPASFIARATHNLMAALAIAGVILAVSLLVLLGSWRAAATAAIAIPLSLMMAWLVLHAWGLGLTMMMVAGLFMATVVVVHDAALDAVAASRGLAARGRAPIGAAVLRAALSVRRPMLFATVIILVAVVPALFMEGISGAFFRPLIWAYIAAVLASMAVAIVVTPVLAALLAPGPDAVPRPSPLDRAHAWFETRARATRGSIWPAAGLVALTALAVLVGLQRFEREPVPSFRETDIVIDWRGPPGMALPEMTRITTSLIRDLRQIPGVQNAAAQIGRAVLCNCEQLADVNSGEVWVSIDPGADHDGTMRAIRAAIADYPGMEGRAGTYLSRKLAEVLVGDADRLTVRVYGHDIGILRGKAEEIRRIMAGIQGVVAPRLEQQPEEAAIEVEVDLARAAAVGLKPGDVRRATATLVSGITVGALFEQQKVFDVVVLGAPHIRASLTDIGNLMLDTEEGVQVRLADVAHVRSAPANSTIRREGVSRLIDVEADVQGRPVGAVARELAERIRDLPFPFEYHAQVQGQHLEPRAALRSVGSYFALGAVLVFLLLQAALGSWRLAAATAAVIPVALLGCLAAMALAGGVLSLGAALGAVAILGLTVRAAIMLLHRFQELEQQGAGFGDEVVETGIRDGFASIVATLVALGATMLPFVLAGPVAGLEILHPMAATILGGLFGTAIVVLLLLPAIYLRLGAGSATQTLGLDAEPAHFAPSTI
jgi:Cu/Ag efflux pump CusA